MSTRRRPRTCGRTRPARYAVRPDWLRFDEVWDAFRLEHGIHLRRDAAAGNAGSSWPRPSARVHRNLLRADRAAAEGGLVDPQFDELVRRCSERCNCGLQNGVFQPKTPCTRHGGARGVRQSADDIEQAACPARRNRVLVSPTLVATAAHVVWGLLERVGDDPVLLDAHWWRAWAAGSGCASCSASRGLRARRAQERARRRHAGDLPPMVGLGQPPHQAELAQIYDVRDISESSSAARGTSR